MLGLLFILIFSTTAVINDLYLQKGKTWNIYAFLAFAVSLALLPLATIYQLFLAHRLSSLRDIPHVHQEPVWNRLFKEPNSIDMLRWIEDVPNDGLLRYYGILNQERILVTTTEGTKQIHDRDTKDYRRQPAAKAVLCRLTGGALFAAEGSEHAAQRREMQPAFKFRHLKDLYPTFWAKTKELVASLDNYCAGRPAVVEIDDWVTRGTLDAISLAGFGFDFDSIAKPDTDVVRKYRTAFLPGTSVARVRLLANILPIKLLFNLPVKHNKDAKACIKAVRTTLKEVVQNRLSENHDRKHAHVDILSTMLKSKIFTKTEDIVSQCMVFLAAGHEASALTLSWTLFELSKDSERQERLRQEIRSNLLSPLADSAISADQVDSLPYLEAVVKESLRLWAPVPRQTRIPIKRVMISGVMIPANTTIVMSSYATNRSTQNWGDEATNFCPERWMGSPEAITYGGGKDRHAFASFGHGARACIGQKFAHYEILVFLAGLVGRFEWEFVDKPGLPPGTVRADHDSAITLKIGDGLQLRVKPVEGW
jgi:cytochrome P450